jgi:8-amino-7-oxononanoate synthase|tara:strand:- start:22536 stop:23711 length:1176 start_codon:yes stop_codon:yes gene_type:complete
VAQLPWQSQLQQTISDRKAAGLYRRSRLRDGEQGVEVVLDGRKLLSFSSNDYLGLAAHPALKTAFVEALDREGVGSGAAHLLTGHSRYHHQLEQALAEFTGQQRVLLFSTGYMANIGVIDGLLGKTDVVVQDKLNHASLLDGGRLCDAQQLRYPHVDMGLLHQRLHTAANARNKLIVSDGVFSMDGDIAPLPEIMDLAEQHKAGVIIDDAHGFGVLGQNGGGVVEHFALTLQQMPILVGTFGKAFGTAGAFVAADEVVIETLVQQARSFIYTTAQPPAIAAATLASLKLIKQESWRRDKLQQLIQQFRDGAAQLGLPLMPSQTAIQPLLIGDDKTALKLGQDLEQQGILVGIIRPPTVPKNTARLRITLSAAHDVWHIEQLLLGLERSYVH